jgi:hypothetical protein
MAKLTWNAPTIDKEYKEAVGKGVTKASIELANLIKREVGRKSSAPGTPPAVGTGGLRRSWRAKATLFFATLIRGGVRSNSPYAAIHEFGGTITPKKSKYLVIPMNIEARNLLRRYGTVRRVPDLFVLKTGKGLYLAHRRRKGKGKAKGKKLQVLFALKKSVTLPPRPYVRPVLKRYRDVIRQTVQGEILAERSRI